MSKSCVKEHENAMIMYVAGFLRCMAKNPIRDLICWNVRFLHVETQLIASLLILFTLNPISLIAQPLFNPHIVQTIHLTFPDNNWDAQLDSLKALGDERMLATLEIDGEIFDSVGVRYKGNSTYASNRLKNPFNIKLDHIYPTQSYQGISTLKLANGYADPSFVREAVAYEILAKYMPAPRVSYLRVNINGTYHGLYVNTETIDKSFVEEWFGSQNQAFFKCEPQFDSLQPGFCPPGNYASLEYLGPDSACYETFYEIKSDDGWHELIELTYQLGNNPDSLGKILGIDQVLWMLAFNDLLVNLDSYSGKFRHNYYLYRDHYGVFHPIAWDLNMAFGGFNHTGTGGLLSLADMQTLDPLLHQNDPEWPLIHKILSNPKWKKRYLAHFKTLLYENITNNWYVNRAEELQVLITPHVLADSNALFPDEDFLNNIHAPSYHGGFRTGISTLMKPRADFLVNHPLLKPFGPNIFHPAHSPIFPEPNDSVLIQVEVENASKVWLGMRREPFAPFYEILLFDDGLHHDGNSNDNIWGRMIKVDSANVSYYIYAEHDSAGRFFPSRAQHEFLTIKVIDTTRLPSIVINELMADNVSTVSDEEEEFEDWVELYNRSDKDISMSGYHLSDDLSEPEKWAFPDTIIPSGEFLIVWLDEEDDEPGLHANFRLDKSGEELILTGGGEKDSVHFPSQLADISWGRFPNGVGSFASMNPTFAQVNDYHTSLEPQNSPSIKIFPNPANHQLFIDFGRNISGELALFDLMGREMYGFEYNHKSKVNIPVSGYARGIYWVKLNGEVIGKFLKK
ncbi:MAG: CotH kinase family protein [Bacteroidetes bacterium]|nr:CotH kinase family protein [Bacteroidota bacterium]